MQSQKCSTNWIAPVSNPWGNTHRNFGSQQCPEQNSSFSKHFLSAHHKSQLYLFCKITNLTLSFAASRSRRQASLQFRYSWWKSVLLSENHNCSRHLVGNNIILFRNKHNFSFFFFGIYLIFYPNLEETTKKNDPLTDITPLITSSYMAFS